MRQAKVRAAERGISLKTLFLKALMNELSSRKEPAYTAKFPMIRPLDPAPLIVSEALIDDVLLS